MNSLADHLSESINEWCKNNTTERKDILIALMVLCTYMFTKETRVEPIQQLKEIDMFCEALKSFVKGYGTDD